jgi:hypothetical protein
LAPQVVDFEGCLEGLQQAAFRHQAAMSRSLTELEERIQTSCQGTEATVAPPSRGHEDNLRMARDLESANRLAEALSQDKWRLLNRVRV